MAILTVQEKISLGASRRLVWDMIQYSNHSRYSEMQRASKKSIEQWFSNNHQPIDGVTASARNFKTYLIPFVENIIGPTWITQSNGAGVTTQIIDSSARTLAQISGDGETTIDYWSKLEAALKARENVIERGTLDDIHTMCTKIMSSIDSYITSHAAKSDIPLEDNFRHKISFDEKIKKWVPTLANGKRIDLGTSMWEKVQKIKKIRDDHDIHPKSAAIGYAYEDMANTVNAFRDGPAKLLFELHKTFGEAAPSRLVRSIYYPQVSYGNSA